MKTLVVATSALALLTGASSAIAAPPSIETVSVYVSKARLDLNNPADAQRLMRRIDAAALQVCGADSHSLAYVKRAVAASPCHRDAVAGAVAQLSASKVDAGVRSR